MVRYSNSLFLSLATASSGKENNSREWCEKKTAGGGQTTCVWYALHLVCLYSSQLLLLIVKLLAVVGGRKSFSGFLFFFKQLIKLFHVTWEETSVFTYMLLPDRLWSFRPLDMYWISTFCKSFTNTERKFRIFFWKFSHRLKK